MQHKKKVFVVDLFLYIANFKQKDLNIFGGGEENINKKLGIGIEWNSVLCNFRVYGLNCQHIVFRRLSLYYTIMKCMNKDGIFENDEVALSVLLVS